MHVPQCAKSNHFRTPGVSRRYSMGRANHLVTYQICHGCPTLISVFQAIDLQASRESRELSPRSTKLNIAVRPCHKPVTATASISGLLPQIWSLVLVVQATHKFLYVGHINCISFEWHEQYPSNLGRRDERQHARTSLDDSTEICFTVQRVSLYSRRLPYALRSWDGTHRSWCGAVSSVGRI